MNFKRITAIVLCFVILFSLAGCAKKEVNALGIKQKVDPQSTAIVTLDLYAPKEALPAVITVIEQYKNVDPYVNVRVTSDDAVMIAEKVLSGYSCDLLIDFEMIMDQIDGSKDAEVNPYGYSCIYSDTRMDVFTGPADGELFEDGTTTYCVALPLSCKFTDQAKALAEYFKNDACSDACAEYGFTIIQ